VPTTDDGRRAPADIPRQEAENALLFLLEKNVSAPIENLTEEVCRLFQVRRGNPEMEQKVDRAIREVVASGMAVRADSSLRLST
jgi:hypothetical protein